MVPEKIRELGDQITVMNRSEQKSLLSKTFKKKDLSPFFNRLAMFDLIFSIIDSTMTFQSQKRKNSIKNDSSENVYLLV